MLKAVTKSYNEETNELFEYNYCSEGQFICWGRNKTKGDVLEFYNSHCCFGRRYVLETQSEQERLDYLWANKDKWLAEPFHQKMVENGEIDPEHPFNDNLIYRIKVVQLFDDDKLVKEETFRYGRLS